MKTKTTSIIAAVIGTLCAAFAAFVYWQALAVLAAGYGFISRRKHGHDHAA